MPATLLQDFFIEQGGGNFKLQHHHRRRLAPVFFDGGDGDEFATFREPEDRETITSGVGDFEGTDDTLFAVEGQVTKMKPGTAGILGDVKRGDRPVPGIHPLVIILDADDLPLPWWPTVVLPADAFEELVVCHLPRLRGGRRREDDVVKVEYAAGA